MMTGTSGRAAFALGRSSRPLIPGMLMSDKIRIQGLTVSIANSLKSAFSRASKIHYEAAVTQVAPELLPKQHFNIRLVVDNEDQAAHDFAPALPRTALRGRMTLNSVNSPGTVSTSMDPECCLTIMS